MAHSTRAPPDSNGPSTARSHRERQGTGPLCVAALATRGFLQPCALQQHMHTTSAEPWPPLATDVKCTRARRVWRAEVAGEVPVVAVLRWSCIVQ